jgi:HK97 family phage portal protein
MELFRGFKVGWEPEFVSLGLTSFRNSGDSTFASPSSEFVHSLIGLPTASGKVVTKETAIRVASFLGGVKMLCNDLAKMPLILRQTKTVGGRPRTLPAVDEPLYGILRYCLNSYQTSYQARWFLYSQLIMNGNCYCQKITDQAGDLIALVPLNAWHMRPHWDRSNPDLPVLKYAYTNMGQGGIIEFTQDQIWHTSSLNLEGFGLEGSPTILLAKEALSLLMASEEVAGRVFSNGLSMGGFLTSADADSAPTEIQAQNTLDRLKKDYAGSQNAGKFTYVPNMKFEKMSFNAQESQLLESRKWSEQEVVRFLGGAPLLVKMGLGEQNSTYAASQGFLDEYFNTSLLPFSTAIEDSITRDLIPQRKWGKLYAKHYSDIILRGSPKERAETNSALILSYQLTPNEARQIEDRDTIEGGDFLAGPASGCIYDPETGEFFIPGQKPPDPDDPDDADEGSTDPEADEPDVDGGDGDDNADPVPPTKPPVKKKPVVKPVKKTNARLEALATSMADRIIRKETNGKVTAKFVAEVLNVPIEKAEEYVAHRSDYTTEQAQAVLIALAIGDDYE